MSRHVLKILFSKKKMTILDIMNSLTELKVFVFLN